MSIKLKDYIKEDNNKISKDKLLKHLKKILFGRTNK